MEPITLGSIIKNHRNEKGITGREVAEIVNIKASYLSQLENGYRPITIKNLVRISNALGVAPADLLYQTLAANKKLKPEEKELFEKTKTMIHKMLELLSE